MTAKKLKEVKALIVSNGEGQKDEGIEGEVMPKPVKDRWGRYTVMTKEVLDKLTEAFAWGCTNKEAALYAGISERTLDKYNNKDPEFKERCQELKMTPILKARAFLVKTSQGSAYYALKLLERLKSDEWSLRVRQTFDEPEPLTPEEQKELDGILDDNI